jgi:acyl-CoA hydrolase|tara:strand:+ start:2101 stop:2490 length:390 start_codon:yes stop_codon:yes gene_type:complete
MNRSVEEKIKQSRTSLFRAVFPELTNHHNTMLGGKAIEIMDEVAFITATRFSRKRFVVAGSEVNYTKPIPAGTLIEVIGEINEVGQTSVKVSVKVFIEEMYSNKREQAIDATFTCVAIDENKNSIPVLD